MEDTNNTPEVEIEETETPNAYWLEIDGERFELDEDASTERDGSLSVECGRREFVVFKDSDVAGEAAKSRWEDMKDNDKREFRCIIGDERLIQWACGDSDEYGCRGFDTTVTRATWKCPPSWRKFSAGTSPTSSPIAAIE